MLINSIIIEAIYRQPVKNSLRDFGPEFFLELAEAFRVDLNPDQKMSEAINVILHSMPGKALSKVYFYCDTAKSIYDRFCERWEIYALCYLLGVGEQTNKFTAAERLIERIIEIREKGLEIELCAIPDESLNKMFQEYYGQKKIQIRGRGQGRVFTTRRDYNFQRIY